MTKNNASSSKSSRAPSKSVPESKVLELEKSVERDIDLLTDELVEVFDNKLMVDDELQAFFTDGVTLSLKFTINDTKATISIPKRLLIKRILESKETD